MKAKKTLQSAIVFAAIFTPALVSAAVLSHETFSGYTAGEIQTVTPSPSVAGYTGNWTDVDFGDAEPSITVGSLSYADPLYAGSGGDSVSVPNNVVGGEINAANSGRVFRLLDSTLAVNSSTTGTIYLSFLYQNGQQTGATTFQMLSLYDGNTADANRNFTAGLTTNGGQTGNQYNFGVENGTGETYSSSGVAADTGVHLFVVKFDLSALAGSDSVTLWLDPDLGAGDPLGGTTITGKDLTWDRLAFSDYEGNSAAWDEVRWGTDFNSVTVPEPGTALLGSLGVLALLRRRRN
ncbi:MAG: PEP-CTERM sorting domain-containing protein [Verrucomicrobiota bacterium]